MSTDPQSVPVDDEYAESTYANFCRVMGTPEEVILDLALNPHGPGQNQTVKIQQRIIVNYYTAKRLASLLASVIHHHEQTFGQLEVDVRKRLKPGAAGSASLGGGRGGQS